METYFMAGLLVGVRVYSGFVGARTRRNVLCVVDYYRDGKETGAPRYVSAELNVEWNITERRERGSKFHGEMRGREKGTGNGEVLSWGDQPTDVGHGKCSPFILSETVCCSGKGSVHPHELLNPFYNSVGRMTRAPLLLRRDKSSQRPCIGN